MALIRRKQHHREDIVATSLSEIILFFLFFFLILLASVLDINPGRDDGPDPKEGDGNSLDQQIIIVGLQKELENLRLLLVDEETAREAAQNAATQALRAQQVAENALDEVRVLLGDANDEIARLNIIVAEAEGSVVSAVPDGDADGSKDPSDIDENPIFVTFPHSAGYVFPTDSYIVGPDFRIAFDAEGLVRMRDLLANFDGEIAAIEVIGHTDEQPFVGSMDQNILQVLNDGGTSMRPADNAGLGLARAVATAVFLRETMPDELEGLPIIPLSASFLQDVDGNIVTHTIPIDIEDTDRRRIEIRIRSAQ